MSRTWGVESGKSSEWVLATDRMAQRVFVFCLACEILLVFLDYRINFSHYTEIQPIRRFLNITREDSLASWFGNIQTTLLAVTAWIIAGVTRHKNASRWKRVGWILLAIFFTYMAFDDGTQFHERMGSSFKEIEEDISAEQPSVTTGARLLQAFPSYPWQILFLPLYGGLGLFTIFFLWKESELRRTRFMVLAAIGLFVIAVGLDFIEGLQPDHPLNAYSWIEKQYNFDAYATEHFRASTFEACLHFSKSIEEFLEMLANTLLWNVALWHLGRQNAGVRVRLTEG